MLNEKYYNNMITIKLSKKHLEMLEAISDYHKDFTLSRSEVIRYCIEQKYKLLGLEKNGQ